MKPFTCLSLLISLLYSSAALAQTGFLSGTVMAEGKAVPWATVELRKTEHGAITDTTGGFQLKNISAGTYRLRISCIGYAELERTVQVSAQGLVLPSLILISNKSVLNEVVVTGVSRKTLIRENPVAIVSVSARAIERTAESNIVDALVRNTPGLNAVKTGPNISKPFIRGLGYNRVLTLYDGMRQEGQQWGDEHGLEVDAYNMERAEIIKGPASLLYGSDAVAGVISLFPFIPSGDEGRVQGKFSTEYQTNNNLVGTGLRLGLSQAHFVFALRGSYRRAKNYRNAIDGRVYNTGFEEKNLSLLTGYKNDRGHSYLNISLYDNLQSIPDGSRDSTTRKFTKQMEEGGNDDIRQRTIVTNEELNTYTLSPLHQHIQHYRLYTHHSYAIGDGEIDALIGLQQNIRREYNHPSLPQQAGMYVRLNTLNYGLRYNAPRWKDLEITAGINGMLQSNKSLNATDFPIPDYRLFDGGLYLYGKWKKQDWTISGGIRYDIRRVSWDDFYVKNNSATGFNQHAAFGDTVGTTLQFAAYKKNFSGLSASVGLTWQASEHISLKANIGRGYRAPNLTEMASNGLDPGAHIIYLGNRNFRPEFSLQQDLGLSARFTDFSAEASLFHNAIDHYIYLTLLVDATGNPLTDAQGNKTYQYQQAAAQLYGLEGWLSIHPQKFKGFNWSNSVSLVQGVNRKIEYKGEGLNGEYLPLIPPLKWVSSLAQTIGLKKSGSLTPKIELEWNAAQQRFLGLNNTETSTPAYALLNVGMSSEWNYSKAHTVQILVQVNNLLDKAYQSGLSRLKYFEYYSGSPNGSLGIYNMGINVCTKLVFPF